MPFKFVEDIENLLTFKLKEKLDLDKVALEFKKTNFEETFPHIEINGLGFNDMTVAINLKDKDSKYIAAFTNKKIEIKFEGKLKETKKAFENIIKFLKQGEVNIEFSSDTTKTTSIIKDIELTKTFLNQELLKKIREINPQVYLVSSTIMMINEDDSEEIIVVGHKNKKDLIEKKVVMTYPTHLKEKLERL